MARHNSRVGAFTTGCGLLAVVWALGSFSAAKAEDFGIEQAEALWRAAGMSDYEYAYLRFCECHPDSPPETIVTVVDGAVAGVRHHGGVFASETSAARKDIQLYWTIDELFGVLERAAAHNVLVRAAFDDTLGYPTSLYIDYDENLIGDEVDMRLTRVTRKP